MRPYADGSQGRPLHEELALEPTPFFPELPGSSPFAARWTRFARLCTGPSKHEDPDYNNQPVYTKSLSCAFSMFATIAIATYETEKIIITPCTVISLPSPAKYTHPPPGASLRMVHG